MRHYFSVFFLLVIGNISFAQSTVDSIKKSSKDTVIRLCAPSRASVLANPPLYLINGKKTLNVLTLNAIYPGDIENLVVSKDKKQVEKYGYEAKNGVIEVTLKKNIKLLTVNEVLKKFKIKKQDYSLPIYVNERVLENRHDFYLANNKIANVQVISYDSKQPVNRSIHIALKP